MTDETKREVVEHATRAGRDPQWRRGNNRGFAVVGLLLLVAGGAAIYLFMTTASLRDEAAGLHGQVAALASQQSVAAVGEQKLAGQISAMGGTPVVTPVAPVTGQPGPTGPQGPGPSQAQIDEAVNSYFAAHPPGATPAMIAVQVASYLTANPPAPGRPPTQQEIATATSDYLSAHAAQFQGQTGATGATGPAGQNATDEQVASAVAAYCSTHNGCAGPAGPAGADGKQGVQGVSVTNLQFQRVQGQCEVVITLHDPATDADTTITHPAGAAACPVLGNGN